MSKAENGSFISLYHDLVRSEAWVGLSANAVKVLIGIWDQYNGHNNGDLRFGYEHAMRLLRCSTATAKRTFAELKNTGLIVAVEKGSFAHKGGTRHGIVTAWRITAIKPTGKPNGKATARRRRNSFDGVPGDP